MNNSDLTPQEAKKLFKLYCENTGQDEDSADALLMVIPPLAAIEMLKVQKETVD